MRRIDVPTEVELCVMDQHTDYVRCAIESPSNEHTWISGSYDHTVKLWDVRMPATSLAGKKGQRGPSCASVMTLEQGAPVESLLAMPNGGLLFAAGTILHHSLLYVISGSE
jgi:U3 small nucleolar RNA-associated protein 15